MARFRYVPILRWKEGEQDGVRFLQASDRTGIIPIFMLEAEQYKGRKATKTKVAVSSADHFVTQVLKAWGKDPFYLDASGMMPAGGVQHPILAIATSARAQGLQMIPATPLGAPPLYAAAVAAIAGHDRRGVALRVDLQEFSSAASWAGAWPHPLAETDLIADFTTNIGAVAALGSHIQTVFQGLHLGTGWRTVTVAGSSMPPNFSGFTKGLHTIQMENYALWSTLHPAMPYRLDYGDYATPSLGVLPPGISWGYPINARYTIPGQYLICKGVKTIGAGSVDMAPQLVGHANDILTYSGRHRQSGCWADDEIDAIAAGKAPQNLLHWVKIGVNRHLTLLRRIVP
ncbi:hypothetical protein F8B43_4177 [Methylorubrum populi]|uniref:Uncharacterized protein n=1 Tax=Methylorubrum populi TaxID=223967 RepID=A0A833J1H2_9HYPH|nr:hypothetical protein F8B43_4177 [Methylorubrum populi]